MSNEGVSQSPEGKDGNHGRAAYTSNGPIQVVVVQQPSSKADSGDICDVVDALWPGRPDSDSDGTPSQRIRIKSSRANLIIAVLLLILAVLQGLGLYESHSRGSNSGAQSDPKLVEQLSGLNNAIKELTHGGGIKIVIADGRPDGQPQGSRVSRRDPQLHSDLTALINLLTEKLSPTEPEVRVILIPGTGHQALTDLTPGVAAVNAKSKTNASPPELSTMPCVDNDAKQPISTPIPLIDSLPCKGLQTRVAAGKESPILIPVKYKNDGPDDLLLLDAGGYWSLGFGDTTGQNLNGICSNDAAAQDAVPIPYGTFVWRPVSVRLDPGWPRQNRREADAFRNKKEMYLVLCTTFSGSDQSNQVTKRTVFRVHSFGEEPVTFQEVYSTKSTRLP